MTAQKTSGFFRQVVGSGLVGPAQLKKPDTPVFVPAIGRQRGKQTGAQVGAQVFLVSGHGIHHAQPGGFG